MLRFQRFARSPPLLLLLAMAAAGPHAFAGNPLRAASTPPAIASGDAAVIPFSGGRPLARSGGADDDPAAPWRLGWVLPSRLDGVPPDSFVYLGDGGDGGAKWAVDVSELDGAGVARDGESFVDLRMLMTAADWRDSAAMEQLAIAGHARALLEWHKISKFCGSCGDRMTTTEAGRRKKCTNDACKKRIYPRIDPVVIMLVIDKENDRALLSKQSRYAPRMWSCLAGFLEPGESLEEAVRRETLEETGIEVGEVVYHSSQPWPVGPNSMPCQLMVGFLAYAKSLEIKVDKKELEDAQWYSREDVKRALTYAEYSKAQKSSAIKVNQMCRRVEKSQSISSDYNVESGELAPMFVPGPFAIAHHLFSTWAHGTAEGPVSSL